MVKTKKKPKKALGLIQGRGDRVLKILNQTGKRKSIKRDRGRSAKLPGKRQTKKGTIYWETRKNRSDAPLKAI